ncbi:hypothetical protein AVEN_183407-1 [Araneus ventricosus]|uniref:Uncharacterized protein n=1 Tax=Araneus ventricosus TaxID=182803 RepID=A0A4Y2A6Q3_ARAVE|nr:hypothetical protein AVEN_183407-1 [Araneus ventricosus]
MFYMSHKKTANSEHFCGLQDDSGCGDTPHARSRIVIFSCEAWRVTVVLFLLLTYDEEMKKLQKMLEDVSHDEDSIEDYLGDSYNEETFSDQSSFFMGKDKTTKWKRATFRIQKRKASKIL